MKKQLFLILAMIVSLSFSSKIKAQNLVPNPSFEDTIACPQTGGQINYAAGWSAFRNTPDYFNSCVPLNSVSVPANLLGFQYARSGVAYAGVHTYAKGAEYREWIGTALIQPLVIGQKYNVRFYVSLAYKASAQIALASNKLGTRFSTFQYVSNNSFPLNGYAQVYSDSIISDTTNWVGISGSFIADSAYNYIIIGNFFNDAGTDTISFDQNALKAYYYIDDISLFKDTDEGTKDDLNIGSIRIYPNPAADWIEIEGINRKSIFINDVFGRLVYISKSNITPNIRVNVSSFPRGIYFLHIETLDKTIIQKIILQ